MINIEEEILFDEFEPLSFGDWKSKIIQELNGTDYDHIIWKNENFDVHPFYRNDVGTEFPEESRILEFLRSGLEMDWKILQEFDPGDNSKILAALSNNCSSLRLLKGNFNFEKNLQGVIPSYINIYLPSFDVSIMDDFKAWIDTTGSNFQEVAGGINYKPLSDALFHGNIDTNWKEKLIASYRNSTENQDFKIVNVHGGIFENAGASIVQQLGYTISKAVEYLNTFEEKGLSAASVLSKILFEINLGNSFFMEIAKIRALRILWAKIVRAYAPDSRTMSNAYIIGTTSKFMNGAIDLDTNLIRNTTSALSAAIGTCDEILVQNHDLEKSYRSYRFARNIQNLIKEESFVNKVNDPSAGSHYIDTLTYSLVRHSWDLFMQLEATGGFLKNCINGSVQLSIEERAHKKVDALNNNKLIRIGVNSFLKEGTSEKKWTMDKIDGEEIDPIVRIICN